MQGETVSRIFMINIGLQGLSFQIAGIRTLIKRSEAVCAFWLRQNFPLASIHYTTGLYHNITNAVLKTLWYRRPRNKYKRSVLYFIHAAQNKIL